MEVGVLDAKGFKDKNITSDGDVEKLSPYSTKTYKILQLLLSFNLFELNSKLWWKYSNYRSAVLSDFFI